MLRSAIALHLLPAAQVESRCPVGTVQGLSPAERYTYTDAAFGWFEAEEECQERGGRLAPTPNGFVKGLLELPNFSVTSRYWTGGGTGLISANDWSRIDGTATIPTGLKVGS